MGHRASVAYRWTPSGLASMGDSRFENIDDDEIRQNIITVHHSHWGAYNAELLDQITPNFPFGSESLEPPFLGAIVNELTKMADGEVSGRATEPQEPTPVDPKPSAVVESVDEWVDLIDPIWHECVYLVETGEEWNVRAFAPVYWSEGYEAIDDVALTAQTPMVLIDAGRDSHDEWDCVGLPSWMDEEDIEDEKDEPKPTMQDFIDYVEQEYEGRIWKRRYRMPAGVPEP